VLQGNFRRACPIRTKKNGLLQFRLHFFMHFMTLAIGLQVLQEERLNVLKRFIFLFYIINEVQDKSHS